MSGFGFESPKMVEVEEMSETDEFFYFLSLFWSSHKKGFVSTDYASTTLLFPDSNA